MAVTIDCSSVFHLRFHGGKSARFGAQQVAAYHELNDLLTYYTSRCPGESDP